MLWLCKRCIKGGQELCVCVRGLGCDRTQVDLLCQATEQFSARLYLHCVAEGSGAVHVCSQGEAAACGEAGIPESPLENPKLTFQEGGKDPDSFPLEVVKQNPSRVRNINQLKDLPAVELLSLTESHLPSSPWAISPSCAFSLNKEGSLENQQLAGIHSPKR